MNSRIGGCEPYLMAIGYDASDHITGQYIALGIGTDEALLNRIEQAYTLIVGAEPNAIIIDCY
jgi:hypothetical protein